MSPVDRLALEHLTAPSLSPLGLVELAAALDCRAATVLVGPFGAFPQTRDIDLVGDGPARRAVRAAAEREGVAIALAFPFVLSARRDAASFAPALEAAAEVGAQGVGLLIYERDPIRAAEELEAFCSLCAGLSLRPALEFYGGSAVPSLEMANGLKAVGTPLSLGLCVDLLHLVRSGGASGDLRSARWPIIHAQLSDAPLVPSMDRDAEAAHGRLAPGDGELDLAHFVQALPPDIWLGVETPPGQTGDDDDARRRSIMVKARAALLAACGRN